MTFFPLLSGMAGHAYIRRGPLMQGRTGLPTSRNKSSSVDAFNYNRGTGSKHIAEYKSKARLLYNGKEVSCASNAKKHARSKPPQICHPTSTRIENKSLHHHVDRPSSYQSKAKEVGHKRAHTAVLCGIGSWNDHLRIVFRRAGNRGAIPAVLLEALITHLWNSLAVALQTPGKNSASNASRPVVGTLTCSVCLGHNLVTIFDHTGAFFKGIRELLKC